MREPPTDVVVVPNSEVDPRQAGYQRKTNRTILLTKNFVRQNIRNIHLESAVAAELIKQAHMEISIR